MKHTLIFGIIYMISVSVFAQISFIGAGVAFAPIQNGEYPVIKQVLKFSPAEDAGLQAGETVWSVDGKTTKGMTGPQITELIKGSAGVTRTLVVGTSQREVSLTLRSVSGKCTDGDCQNGEGRIEEPTGNIYVGNFTNGKFDGYGMFYYYNGEHMYARYDGHFVAGKMDGEGTMDDYDGGYQFKGNFKSNEVSGKGVLTFYDAPGSYSGNFVKGQPSGQGVFTYADGTTTNITPTSISEILQFAGVDQHAKVEEPVKNNDTGNSSSSENNNTSSSSDDDYDFTELLNIMAKVEYELSYALDAYVSFHSAYYVVLMDQNAEAADAATGDKYVRVADYIISAYDKLEQADAIVRAATFTELQAEALQNWNDGVAGCMRLFEDGIKEGTTPSDWYWMNVNTDKGKDFLEQAAAGRHSF